MDGLFYIVKDSYSKGQAAAAVSNIDVIAGNPVYVKIETKKEKTSNAQQRLAFKWYGEISEQGKEYTIGGIRARCKHRYALPILLAENSGFAEAWKIVEASCDYEQAVDFIERTQLPMTSILGVNKMKKYLDDLQNENAHRYALTDPAIYGL